MPRNKLTDMHNILMEQLERLNDDDLTDEELQAEIKRSRAMADISAQIVALEFILKLLNFKLIITGKLLCFQKC